VFECHVRSSFSFALISRVKFDNRFFIFWCRTFK